MKVNEIFGPTIQGEGKSAGMPAMFLRLAGCNLACVWCDTPYTWNWMNTKFLHPEKYDRKKEVHEMSVQEVICYLKRIGPQTRSLVISGGEPMLQEDELILLMRELKEDNYRIEIETNGTVTPSDEFFRLIDQINCSPKTKNSGPDNQPAARENPEALSEIAWSEKSIFKFIVRSEEDLPEILHLVSLYQMKNVFLMAEGNSREEQQKLSGVVMRMCRESGFYYSPRLHVLLWNRKRGV